MIHYLQGTLVQKFPTYIVLETGGIGYFLHISLHTFSNLPPKDTQGLRIHTFLNIKEDSHTLYGFFEEVERTLFLQLISVSGIGPGTGRMILSSMNPGEISQAIIKGDITALQRIKGIGSKSAQRIILEIQDKVKKLDPGGLLPASAYNTLRDEALEALVILGFVKNLGQRALEKVLGEHPPDSLPLDTLIKLALKNL